MCVRRMFGWRSEEEEKLVKINSSLLGSDPLLRLRQSKKKKKDPKIVSE